MIDWYSPLKTDESLLQKLRYASPIQSKEEMLKQRTSFVMGVLDKDSTLTREQVQEIIYRIYC